MERTMTHPRSLLFPDSPMAGHGSAGRLSVIRAVIGVAHLLAPARSAPGAGGRLTTTGRRVVRVLGARQLTQAAITGRCPGRAVLWLGVEVDATHAATMLAVAACSRRYRRPALGNVAMAAAFAAAGALAARRAPVDPASTSASGRWRDRHTAQLAGRVVPGWPRSRLEPDRDPNPGGTLIGSDPPFVPHGEQ
jgi:hypothetical protein